MEFLPRIQEEGTHLTTAGKIHCSGFMPATNPSTFAQGLLNGPLIFSQWGSPKLCYQVLGSLGLDELLLSVGSHKEERPMVLKEMNPAHSGFSEEEDGTTQKQRSGAFPFLGKREENAYCDHSWL